MWSSARDEKVVILFRTTDQSKSTAISLPSVRGHSHSNLPLYCNWSLLEADLGFWSLWRTFTYPSLLKHTPRHFLFASPVVQSPLLCESPYRNSWTSWSSFLPITYALCDPLWSCEDRGKYLLEKYRHSCSKGHWEKGQATQIVRHLLLWGYRKSPLPFTHPNFLFH